MCIVFKVYFVQFDDIYSSFDYLYLCLVVEDEKECKIDVLELKENISYKELVRKEPKH